MRVDSRALAIRRRRWLAVLVLVGVAVNCQRIYRGSQLLGIWHAELLSPVGTLPFALQLTSTPAGLEASVRQGEQSAAVGRAEVHGHGLVVLQDGMPRLEARIVGGGKSLLGEWRDPKGRLETVRFAARRPTSGLLTSALGWVQSRSSAAGAPLRTTYSDVLGEWSVRVSDREGDQPAVGYVGAEGDVLVAALRMPTGFLCSLTGTFDGRELSLASFDGDDAVLVHAALQPDGTLQGALWSRDGYRAELVANRTMAALTPEAPLERVARLERLARQGGASSGSLREVLEPEAALDGATERLAHLDATTGAAAGPGGEQDERTLQRGDQRSPYDPNVDAQYRSLFGPSHQIQVSR